MPEEIVMPRLSDTMYDWDLPPVVKAEPLPSKCPALPKGRRVRPPDSTARTVSERVPSGIATYV